MCAEVEPNYMEFEEECAELSSYAVEVRYPGEEDPSIEEAREMTTAANRVYRFTRTALDFN
jgi:HEPN domain.